MNLVRKMKEIFYESSNRRLLKKILKVQIECGEVKRCGNNYGEFLIEME